jgi:nucleoside 2-deoxyribosyltransferase
MVLEGKFSFEEYLKIKQGKKGDTEIRNAQPVDFIKRYWDFIKNSDAIFVLNMAKKGIANYIGGSTLIEMGFAYGHGKKIFLYNPIPKKSEQIHYVDEIKDMKPIIINDDLSRIV